MLPLPTEATTEEENELLYGPTPDHVSLKTTNHTSSGIIINVTQTAKRGQENLEWEGVIGSMTSLGSEL